MRIVGGEARGRHLRAVAGNGTRPTADRVRQSLFDWLGQRCDGLAVLDLYSGTGALALEAISRGAARAVLVERDRKACEAIQSNIDALGYDQRCTVAREDVVRALPRLAGAGERFDLIFSDPPYALTAAQMTLESVLLHRLLSPEGRVVLERGRREPLAAPAGFSVEDRRYGDTVVAVVRRA
jgi:16S rRNA (guanine(966)-N(2))-methyltransferase RsmD